MPKSMAVTTDLMHLHARFLKALGSMEGPGAAVVRAKAARHPLHPALKAHHFPVHENTATKRFPVSKPIQHDRNVPEPAAAPTTVHHVAAAAATTPPKRKRSGKVKVDQADPRSVAAAVARHQAG